MDHYLTKKNRKSERESPPVRNTQSLEGSHVESYVEPIQKVDAPSVPNNKVEPHENVNKNVTPHIKGLKTPLYKEYDTKYSVCIVVCLIINTLILIASHVGISAVIKGSNDPNPGPIELVGTCTNDADEAVIFDGSEAKEETATYLGELLEGCDDSTNILICLEEAVQDRFALTFECSQCLANYGPCLRDNCDAACFSDPFVRENCDACSDLHCEFELESCSGIDFIADNLEDSCVNAKDDDVFSEDSEVLTTVTTYVPNIGLSCFESDSQISCVKGGILDLFDLSEDCTTCMFNLLLCMQAECLNECLIGDIPKDTCEPCLASSRCEAELETCTGRDFFGDVSPIPQPTSGGCDNEDDLAILLPDSEALTQTSVYLPTITGTCFQTVGQADAVECVVDEVISRFGFSEDCADCMPSYGACLLQLCADCRPPTFDFDGCEECSNVNCEFDFEVCTGVNFVIDDTEEACVNSNDDLVFTDGSEALTTVTTYLPETAQLCVTEDVQDECVKEALIDRFGMGEDCSGCMFDLLTCMQANCLGDCLVGAPPILGCEACLVSVSCEADFENCTGIDFLSEPVANSLSLIAADSCINAQDNAIFAQGGDVLQPDFYVPDAALACIRSGNDREGCVKTVLFEEFGFSEGCNDCMYEHLNCINQRCQSSCIFPGGACEACLVQTVCERQFERCTGIDFYGSRRRLQDDDALAFTRDGQCLSKDQFTIFQNVELTFVFSIEKTLSGGSYALAALLLLASGVWPYTKNILMAVSWFGNLSQKQRDTLLRIIAILGKWSLVDVFAIILIVDGALLQFILTRRQLPFLLFAEPRQGIYWFGIAAVWALVQGEFIRYLEKKSLKQRNIAEGGSVVGNIDEKERKNKLFKILLAVFSAASLLFSVIGLFLVNLQMNVIGKITGENEGPTKYEYNTFELASALVNSCILFEGHGSKAGAWFLASLFVVLVVIIPLVTCVLMFVVALKFQPSKRDNLLIGFTFGLGNFACLDVWFISLFVFSNQYEGLIAGALGDDAFTCDITPEEIEAGEVCIGLAGETKAGGFMLLFGAFCFWIAQYAAVRLMANSFKFVGTYVEYNSSL